MIRNPSTGLVSAFNEAQAPSLLRRSRVSSDLDDLQLLHEATGWTPNLPLRPSPSMHAQQDFILSNIRQMWRTDADWVSHQIFGAEAQCRAAKGRSGRARGPTIPLPGHTCRHEAHGLLDGHGWRGLDRRED